MFYVQFVQPSGEIRATVWTQTSPVMANQIAFDEPVEIEGMKVELVNGVPTGQLVLR